MSLKPVLRSVVTDHLNHKTVNKATCRTPGKLFPNYVHIRWKAFELLFGKVFLVSFRFS